ncbi:hypothetical protein D3C78_1582220 [compost metagenome]
MACAVEINIDFVALYRAALILSTTEAKTLNIDPPADWNDIRIYRNCTPLLHACA